MDLLLHIFGLFFPFFSVFPNRGIELCYSNICGMHNISKSFAFLELLPLLERPNLDDEHNPTKICCCGGPGKMASREIIRSSAVHRQDF